jgi:dTDP-4-dehydrorhamnose reductase
VKVLLFGKGGQVGWELQRSLLTLGDVVAVDFDSTELCGDFSRTDDVVATVRAVRPDIIVNAAAHTAVDKAESEPEFARTLNATTPGAIAREAAASGAWLMHYSTDYVFDGTGDVPWVEDAPTAPLSVYGRTKLEGEQLINASGCKHITFRTSWVYAARGGNFAKTMLRLAQERDRLTVIDDQFGAPTGADLLADLSALALRVAQTQPRVAGTYHAVPRGETTWHGYARHVVEFARRAGQPIKVPADAIVAVPTSAFPTPAKRPGNSRMNTDKLRRSFGVALPDWRVGVDRMLTEVLGR